MSSSGFTTFSKSAVHSWSLIALLSEIAGGHGTPLSLAAAAVFCGFFARVETYIGTWIRAKLATKMPVLRPVATTVANWSQNFGASRNYSGALRPTTDSNVDIAGPQRVGLDEFAAWLDLVTHQHGEDTVGLDGVVELHPEQAAHGWIHGGFP